MIETQSLDTVAPKGKSQEWKIAELECQKDNLINSKAQTAIYLSKIIPTGIGGS